MEIDASADVRLDLTQFFGLKQVFVSLLVEVADVQWVRPERTYIWEQDGPNIESEELGLIENLKVDLPNHAG